MLNLARRLCQALTAANAGRVVLVCMLTVAILGATDPTAHYNRIGHSIMCVCGCGQILLECNHVGCPDSARMSGELQDQVAGPNGAGADSLIMNWFVAKYGATVLAAPMRGGFDNVAWIVPVTVFVLAIFGTALLVRLWSQRRRLASPSVPVVTSYEVDDATRARIRRETEY